MLYQFFYFVYQKSKMILWSIRSFWYKGSAGNKEQKQVREKAYIYQKQQPKAQRRILQQNMKIWCKYVNIG